MRRYLTVLTVLVLVPAIAMSQGRSRDRSTYSYINEAGQIVFTDAPPPEAAEQEKRIHNDEGIIVDRLAGKKSAEEIAEEQRLARIEREMEEQARRDRALLATYLSVEEIELHRDRRVELFQAQARVTELYLRNLEKRLNGLERDASHFSPYSEDPDAPMINARLLDDLNETKDAIKRHEQNIARYRRDEREIAARFQREIDRFKRLKGIDDSGAATTAVVTTTQ